MNLYVNAKKTSVQISVFLFCFWLVGCNQQFQNSLDSGNSEKSKVILLEIISEAGETVYPSGKTLEIRLYNNKEVEFDFYRPNTPDRIGLPFTSETKKNKVDEEMFQKLFSLINQSDLMNSKDNYPPTKKGIDTAVKKTVKFTTSDSKTKTIILFENDSHLHLEEKVTIYPQSLVKLLKKVQELNKDLRKQVDPQSR